MRTVLYNSKDRTDIVRGCLFGGAVGDALGYPIEFLTEGDIFHKYGPLGITEYDKDSKTGKAVISDDTQMTLFTANGILSGDTSNEVGVKNPWPPHLYVFYAYKDWMKTQKGTIEESKSTLEEGDTHPFSWLLEVPELYARRAPGNTCLSAISGYDGFDDYIENQDRSPNQSKGCGGIMRVAPLALYFPLTPIEKLDKEGAKIAKITHGHSLGYMPAAVLVHIIHRIVFPPKDQKMTLKEIVIEARNTVSSIYGGDPHLQELVNIINKAVFLSENDERDDRKNIHQLGEGWVAEETLAIALYCSLRYQNDFSAGVIAAVNHSGDSDSTGAVTGNILGAFCGFQSIEEKWKTDLELSDVILEIADDLVHGCRISTYTEDKDPDWAQKYCKHHRLKRPEPVLFWKDNEKNGFLSNWYRSKFVINDFEYLHVEQYMMAQKAKMFHDSARYTAILRATEPWECKALGKRVTPFNPDKWNAHKTRIVEAGNRAKFEQNQELKEWLLDTGNAYLAEASPKDNVWGIGLDENDAEKTDFRMWPGQNLLGKILMKLREEFSKESNTTLSLIMGDITKTENVDAIVNAANNSLLGGGGVDGAIHKVAGPQLLEECRRLHGCKTGEAKLTKAYNLPCKYIIHTVGPIWNGGSGNEKELLASCYRNSLQIAIDHNIRSVAFPAISTGAYCFPAEEAAAIAVKTTVRFINEHPGKLDLIRWVLFDKKTLEAYKNAMHK